MYHRYLSAPDWDGEQTRKEWSQLLFAHPADVSLWRRYLAFQQHGSGFGLTGLLSAFARCLDRMRQFQAGLMRPHRPPPRLEQFMLEVLSHLCRILRQAGFMERAIAIYQALLELNLFSPPQDGSALASTLAAMEPFWDARLARLGEPGARGWPAELAARQERAPDESAEPVDELEERLLAERRPRPEVWRLVECRREELHWLPWDRPGREDDCEDTDRIVLFEDVKRFLFYLSPELLGRAVEDFVAFLSGEDSEDTSPGDDTLALLALDGGALGASFSVPAVGSRMDSSECVE
ncbi:nuclear exosome regulator NRDE2-like [Pollicipes pollicipes]|uniref:nuclear exosome regulator NRDE2-like n=1 Tax=Pollicipes pollicipes TaxID=41117 RepID=UPI0018850DA2|nr:nuclear exosome regulator NRDE2-like [Pollicipes pollicipes]